jgi:hypothetical protein
MRTLLFLLFLAVLASAACTAQPASSRCVEVGLEGTTDLGFPVVLPIGNEPMVGGGAFPAPARVGEHSGTLASVVTHQEIDGEGVARFALVHYFEAKGGDAFWTEDEALCTPFPGVAAACDVTTQMRVVGGTGRFAGASGALRNEGRITFTDPSFQTSPYGVLAFRTTGRVCAPGL